ncbi:predicted protein [Naegleria gruberi]|uniref:Predicted protein n=1 Tax=Naegleria gruberi TaxID=5762 RepID=D2VIV3_NAEGR|nr:uncharacterized protein NAEGRDRAFT_49904 [Naegleria gruberi]EFC43339.1 predicted protein [Naegleria gruberi]|eukprot:XP_002676083.1 predicted protein [Naegleria gruberi strain NEG-M]
MSSLATRAQLYNPVGIFVSSNNEVYIADYSNHRIRKILKNGNIATIAGKGTCGFSGDNGPATNAQIYYPSSVFVSSNNEVYIADQSNHRIRKILENGNIVTIAGNGIGGFSGDNGPATNAQIYYPYSVFVSSNNVVYIVDYGNNRVRKILGNGNIVTIAGNGTSGFSGDNGPATNAQLNNPVGVFVSSNNEVYIADQSNHRIRKILENGNIVTIAGNGTGGFGGDNGPATNAQLYIPYSVFVSNNEVYIVDYGNNRIRKILGNGNIVTIAGNGTSGFSGDNGPATNAQLNRPSSVFVSNNEVYIADLNNHKIRKILENGNIITIAGNGTKGFSGDSPFDIRMYPHIGNNLFTGSSILYSKIQVHNLCKHSRDQLFGLQIYGFIPFIEKISPQFSNILKNEKILCLMSSSQQEIIQKLIDSLIYDKDKVMFSKEETLDVLFILGLFKNGEFIDLKRSLTSGFVNSLTLENLLLKWETIEILLKICKEEFNVQNYILDHLNNYCIEYAVVQMKTKEGNALLSTLPIIMRNGATIFPKLIITQPTAINIEETIEIKPQTIESLYNDMKTSDVKIKMGQNKYLYCHKTVLSFSSTFFNALFDSGSCFSDLSDDGVFTLNEPEDLELLEIVIKYCYGISIDKIDPVKSMGLLDMAMKHEIPYLVDYCKNSFNLSIDNYFNMLEVCENYFDLQLFEPCFREFVKFSIANRKQLFSDRDRISKLPEKVLQEMVFSFSQDF